MGERGNGDEGFYALVMKVTSAEGDEFTEIKGRLIESVARCADDPALLMRLLQVMGQQGPEERGEEIARNLEAAMKHIGDQIVPLD